MVSIATLDFFRTLGRDAGPLKENMLRSGELLKSIVLTVAASDQTWRPFYNVVGL